MDTGHCRPLPLRGLGVRRRWPERGAAARALAASRADGGNNHFNNYKCPIDFIKLFELFDDGVFEKLNEGWLFVDGIFDKLDDGKLFDDGGLFDDGVFDDGVFDNGGLDKLDGGKLFDNGVFDKLDDGGLFEDGVFQKLDDGGLLRFTIHGHPVQSGGKGVMCRIGKLLRPSDVGAQDPTVVRQDLRALRLEHAQRAFNGVRGQT